jgi:hypothetical protein
MTVKTALDSPGCTSMIRKFSGRFLERRVRACSMLPLRNIEPGAARSSRPPSMSLRSTYRANLTAWPQTSYRSSTRSPGFRAEDALL